MYFLIEDKDSLENIIIFGIKSALISERNLTASSSIANREFHFLKLKNFFFGMDFFSSSLELKVALVAGYVTTVASTGFN